MQPRALVTFLCLVVLGVAANAATLERKPADPSFQKFRPIKAPKPAGLLLKRGDRLAICGDSITEQKMYSRIMETYLTVCVPGLEVTTRQYGWSGEKVWGFIGRMTSDCLRFKPTIATTCYGMNDHEYRPYENRIGIMYQEGSEAIVRVFKESGCRVVQGSPGCVGKVPWWVKTAGGTVDDLNINLCQLRNLGIKVAREEHVGFADVFWPMLMAGAEGKRQFGTNYAMAGEDGVHPGWAGQMVMAYAFLKSLGLDGEIGTVTVDLGGRESPKLSPGHELMNGSMRAGEIQIRSMRYPFCATNLVMTDTNVRSAMLLVPFNQELNRFVLVGKNAKAKGYNVRWGERSKAYSANTLARGVNLAEDFPENPFWPAFRKVDEAVAAKQAYETKQIKELFRSREANENIAAVVAKSEQERAKLVAQIKAAFVPVTHTIVIEAL